MRVYSIFLSIMLCVASHVCGAEDLTPDDLTIVLNELNKNEWLDIRWMVSVQRHVVELADRVKEDQTINKQELAALKDEISKAREKGKERRSIRCTPILLFQIVEHANAIKELRSSQEKHVTFSEPKGSLDAE